MTTGGPPGELTYTEEHILRGIREGRRDPEIAVSLGIPVGDVKARIERLSRLAGVSSREDLGRWDPSDEASPETGATEETEPPMPAPRGLRVPWVAALATVAAVAIAGAALWFVTRDSDAERAVEDAPAEFLADGAVGPPVQRLRFVASTGFPPNVLMYVLRQCEGCDSAIALDRVYRDQFGELRSEAIFRPNSAAGHYILSVWAERDASDIVVAVCEQGTCGGARELTADAATRFYRSRDGGATWVDIGAVAGRGHTVSGSEQELVLVRAEHEGILTYEVLGGDGSEDVSGLIPPGPPVEFTLIQELDAETVQALSRVATNAAGVFAYSWYPQSDAPEDDGVATRIGIADRFGNTGKVLEYIGAPLLLGAWLDASTVAATVSQAPGTVLPAANTGPPRVYMPALIDIANGTVTSFWEPFTNTRYASAINEVIAAVRGEFVRVAAGPAGDCLSIYRSPRREAQESACVAVGALVTVAETRMVVSEEWYLVRAQSGATGWVRPEDLDALLQPG